MSTTDTTTTTSWTAWMRLSRREPWRRIGTADTEAGANALLREATRGLRLSDELILPFGKDANEKPPTRRSAR